MYEIEFVSSAVEDMKALKKVEQQEILDGIESQLQHEPDVGTRNRKKLRPNPVAEWELRIGRFRVFYNIEDEIRIVSIEAIGFKIGNLLFVRNERREL